MKTSIAAIAFALVYAVSSVRAEYEMANDMNATDVSSTKRGKSSPTSFVPVGVISNDMDAKNNTILVTNSNIVISLSDRVQLAHIIKDILPNASKTDSANTTSTKDLFDLLTQTPGVLSDAAGIISAAKNGNTSALTGHVVDLLRAAADPAAPVVALPAAALHAIVPQATLVDTTATPATSVAPMYMRSPMSPLVALAAAATTST